MIANQNDGTMAVRMWRGILWGGLALVLALPAVAMRFTREVDWSASDFVVMGGLLALLGLGVEAAMRWFKGRRARLAAVVAVLLLFLAIWSEMAVGIAGTAIAGS